MLVKAFRYQINRDSNTTIVITTTEYEALVLTEIFGKEQVIKVSEASAVTRNESEEGARLIAKYGLPVLRQIFGADVEANVLAAVKKAKYKQAGKTPEPSEESDEAAAV